VTKEKSFITFSSEEICHPLPISVPPNGASLPHRHLLPTVSRSGVRSTRISQVLMIYNIFFVVIDEEVKQAKAFVPVNQSNPGVMFLLKASGLIRNTSFSS
jgi:hypothetical protein